MKVNIFLLITGIVLLSVAAVFDVNYLDYKSPVPYAQSQMISLYDFRGLKKPHLTLFGVSEFAYIKTSREVYYPGNDSVIITTYFHPSRSYVYERQLRNPGLLRHELYHFHIAEYFSRLLRKEIEAGNNKLGRREIDDFEKKYCLMEMEWQQQYDEDSYHSYVMREQKKWETRVDSLLLSLEAFSMEAVHFRKIE